MTLAGTSTNNPMSRIDEVSTHNTHTLHYIACVVLTRRVQYYEMNFSPTFQKGMSLQLDLPDKLLRVLISARSHRISMIMLKRTKSLCLF